ncbi:hypothetical protein AVEN_152651-1 [Araneus ventricosus]|uniref:Uncharacterized protein n=1 Tax=Araneus ventricosus TaxID=182803 RepID=A0A4Y2SU40_ARAVE|nr:hypothetical protein AVEN_59956-1 [Araneus ventricosus]GBN95021.1 hypothetical protein AVEN_152651-1 [Araneus ventricosus]
MAQNKSPPFVYAWLVKSRDPLNPVAKCYCEVSPSLVPTTTDHTGHLRGRRKSIKSVVKRPRLTQTQRDSEEDERGVACIGTTSRAGRRWAVTR